MCLCIYYCSHNVFLHTKNISRYMKNLTTMCCPHKKGLGVWTTGRFNFVLTLLCEMLTIYDFEKICVSISYGCLLHLGLSIL